MRPPSKVIQVRGNTKLLDLTHLPPCQRQVASRVPLSVVIIDRQQTGQVFEASNIACASKVLKNGFLHVESMNGVYRVYVDKIRVSDMEVKKNDVLLLLKTSTRKRGINYTYFKQLSRNNSDRQQAWIIEYENGSLFIQKMPLKMEYMMQGAKGTPEVPRVHATRQGQKNGRQLHLKPRIQRRQRATRKSSSQIVPRSLF